MNSVLLVILLLLVFANIGTSHDPNGFKKITETKTQEEMLKAELFSNSSTGEFMVFYDSCEDSECRTSKREIKFYDRNLQEVEKSKIKFPVTSAILQHRTDEK